MATEVSQKEAAAQVQIGEADEFAALLKQSFKPRTERAASEVENAVSTLVTEALKDTSVIKTDVLDTIEEMIARLDQKLSAQVNEIIHAPEFQTIESAWRGLSYLVFNSETDANLKIRVLNVSKNELYRNLRLYPDARWDQSPLFKQLYEYEFGQLGGQPYGALIGDYYFSHLPTDVQLAARPEQDRRCGACSVPCRSRADLDGNGLPGPSCPIRATSARFSIRRNMRPGRDCGIRTIRVMSDCVCPRVLARLPYGAKSEPVEEFAFEEDTDGHSGEKYGWMNAAYAMAVNINRAFKEYGWTTRIRGVQSGGEVINLPTHTFPTDDGGVDLKCPTEIAISDRREHELAKSGLIPLIHRKNTDKAAFIGAQSLYKPKKYFGEKGVDATASDNLSSRLPYMFAVSRFAHYLKCMVRDKIGSMKEKEELTVWLQTWINEYVDPNPAMSTEAMKARRPLAAASVEVIPNEENPGYYNARFMLRPHFQLEAMDIGLSLVSRLPGPGSDLRRLLCSL